MRKWADAYWNAVAQQDAETLRAFFAPEAVIRWHCTNEQFDREGFLRANCEYPGAWNGNVERLEVLEDGLCTAAHIWSSEISCHVVSFFRFRADGLITALDEYWGDDGLPPSWRQAMQLSASIQSKTAVQT